MRVSLWLLVVLILAGTMLVLSACDGQDIDNAGENGDEVPSFEKREVFSGEVKNFPEDWEGKLVYVNFLNTN